MSNYQKLGGKRLFFKETGIYNDWAQIKKLPSIDTLVDIGVGINGTPELYNHFDSAHLVLIDPATEAKNYAETNLTARSHSFYNCGVGEKSGELILNVEEEFLRKVGELCNKPDLEKETLILDIANLSELNDNNNKPKRTTWRNRSQNQ